MSDVVNKYDMKNCQRITTAEKHQQLETHAAAALIIETFQVPFSHCSVSEQTWTEQKPIEPLAPLIPNWIARNLNNSRSKIWVDEFISIWIPKMQWIGLKWIRFENVLIALDGAVQRVYAKYITARETNSLLELQLILQCIPEARWKLPGNKLHCFIRSCRFSANCFVCAPAKFRWNTKISG